MLMSPLMERAFSSTSLDLVGLGRAAGLEVQLGRGVTRERASTQSRDPVAIPTSMSPEAGVDPDVARGDAADRDVARRGVHVGSLFRLVDLDVAGGRVDLGGAHMLQVHVARRAVDTRLPGDLLELDVARGDLDVDLGVTPRPEMSANARLARTVAPCGAATRTR